MADANRVAAANWAREKFNITAFVLDDGFQHRRAKRDLDIVLLDATNPFGNSKTLPFGILREPLANLKRADLIVITRANLVGAEQISNLKSQISNLNPTCPIFTAENKISSLTQLKEFHAEAQSSQRTTDEHLFEKDKKPETWKLKLGTRNLEPESWNLELGTRKAIAFCALGNPDNFFEQLRLENFELATTKKFPDHHRYTQNDIANLETEAKQKGADVLLLTTAKDAVKLTDLQFSFPCFVVESRMIFDNERNLRELINAVLVKKS